MNSPRIRMEPGNSAPIPDKNTYGFLGVIGEIVFFISFILGVWLFQLTTEIDIDIDSGYSDGDIGWFAGQGAIIMAVSLVGLFIWPVLVYATYVLADIRRIGIEKDKVTLTTNTKERKS